MTFFFGRADVRGAKLELYASNYTVRGSLILYHLKVGSSCQDLGLVYASFRWFASNGYKVSDQLLQQSLADMPKQMRQERQDGSPTSRVAHVTCLAC